jgi:hypothetical protein
MAPKKQVVDVVEVKAEKPMLLWTNTALGNFARIIDPEYARYFSGYGGREAVAQIQRDDFRNCCAFDIIHNFYDPYIERLTPKFADVLVALKLKALRDAPYFLIATTDKQPLSSASLERIGMIKLSTVRNPNSGNMVTLWQSPKMAR